MKDIKTLKEILSFLNDLKKFFIENDKQDVVRYLDILIIDLEKVIKEIEKEEKKDFDFEL